jgi:chorismate dehydratase
VYSVFVALAQNWSAVRHLEIDPASQTSVNLLHCLLREQGICEPPPAQLRDPLSPLGPRHARLLIGDQALRLREKFRERYRYWDLGEHWQRTMGLPFVYAVWLIRPEVRGAAGIAAKLRARRDANLAQLDRVIAAQTDFAPDFCEYYFRSCLRFACDRRAKDGLQAFGELCQKHNILPQKERTLRFA